ncbi:MAG: sugar ABC transporter permease [Verrucomicrobia bacterium]|nr:sugar ABC transporter permease [Verrucomicrobiota bacterium]MCH8528099.1 sugar ABC transporter permease [Kiritimatiellia bacterium]
MTDAALPVSPAPGKQTFARLLNRLKELSKLYMLVLPSSIIILVLGYYPKIDVVVKSMYRWVPGEVEEFIGFKNFIDAFSDPLFWNSFQLIFILLIANLFKMWPGIFAAVALHRLMNEKARYIFQVCFVIPMVIPGMVWLLIWKSFYDPDFGVFNRILNASGLMNFLHWLDGSRDVPGVMPRLASALEPLIDGPITLLFASTWGLILSGSFLLTLSGHGADKSTRHKASGIILATSLIPLLVSNAPSNGVVFILAIAVFASLMFALAKTLGPRWVIWMFLFFGSLYGFANNFPLLFLNVAAGILISEILRQTRERFNAEAKIKFIATALFLFGTFLVLFAQTWTDPTGQFELGTPAWLGNRDLVIPALLFWGFPWVGTMGVLIYLAGLQQIPTDVYEAAEIDGIGPIGMLFRIELPLILTQVRINLIFMTIATLTSYEMFLILLGPSGGPGNRGMVPGLYMFSKAFIDGQFGYACALGMVLFVIILGLTVIYNKYVKVDK